MNETLRKTCPLAALEHPTAKIEYVDEECERQPTEELSSQVGLQSSCG